MAYVYILFSRKDRKTYVGSTNNLLERLKYHNKGCVPATKRRDYKTASGRRYLLKNILHWGVAKR